jgi:hypothetical protein
MIIQKAYPAQPLRQFKNLAPVVAMPLGEPPSVAPAAAMAAAAAACAPTAPAIAAVSLAQAAPRRLSDGEIFTVVVRDIGLPAAAVLFPNAAPSINLVAAAWNGVDAVRKLNDPKADTQEKALALTKAAAGFVNAGLNVVAPENHLARGIGSLAGITVNGAAVIHKLQQQPSTQPR